MASIVQHLLLIATIVKLAHTANILMMTMGGTKSHKIPFWELSRGLVPRGHNITFISAFPPDFHLQSLEEITPAGLVFYVKNFTNWDLVGAKIRGEEPVHPLDMIRYAYEACDAFLSDTETKTFLASKPQFDLVILDGAYPECGLGLVRYFNLPFMYINTVGFYTGSLSTAGNPVPYSITPFFGRPFTDTMNIFERTLNTAWHLAANVMHHFTIRWMLEPVVRRHFGADFPSLYELSSNVSFILQNAHATVSYPRPYLPNVAEIACIHCKKPKPLPEHLEEFIRGSGDAGFIYFSMGSSVKAANMPEYLRRMLLRVFRQLPQRVLWKYEAEEAMPDLPPNVRLGRWLPQQDVLGHPKIRAFVTHGGLLSMYETVYHGVPVVTMPVFCDHDANAAKAVQDGYALKLELGSITAEALLWSIKKVIYDSRYREAARRRQTLLRDQRETPLERAVYWTEYVLRHRGAKHLQSPGRHMTFVEYYLIDVGFLVLLLAYVIWVIVRLFFRIFISFLNGSISVRLFKKNIKIE